jgi:hypothetical protein
MVFCLCWIFFFLRYTLCGNTYNLCPEFISNNIFVEDILFWIGYFNSMINPFLYNFTNQDFGRAFRSLLNRCRTKFCCSYFAGNGKYDKRASVNTFKSNSNLHNSTPLLN